MHFKNKAHAPDGTLCHVGFNSISRKSRALAAGLRLSAVAKQLTDTAGFLHLHEAVRVANMRAEALRMVVRFSHLDGTPRFKMVTVPTDTSDQEVVRATSGHSFDIADDIVSILQNAAREAR